MPATTANATQAAGQATFLKTLFSVAHDMSAVQRFSRLRLVHPENVLQHTGMVCLFAYAIGRRLQHLRPTNDPQYLDMGKVMCRAVAHDLDETITGDIVRPTKYFSATIRAELAKLEATGINNIASALNLHSITADFMKAKEGREGYVVKLADLLAAICTLWTEVRVCGNRAMVQPAEHMMEVLVRLAPPSVEMFKTAEFNVLSEIRNEAGALLGEVLHAYKSPLPSIHGEI